MSPDSPQPHPAASTLRFQPMVCLQLLHRSIAMRARRQLRGAAHPPSMRAAQRAQLVSSQRVSSQTEPKVCVELYGIGRITTEWHRPSVGVKRHGDALALRGCRCGQELYWNNQKWITGAKHCSWIRLLKASFWHSSKTPNESQVPKSIFFSIYGFSVSVVN